MTTVKQKKFVRAVAAHGNATRAIVEAGYSPSNSNSAKAMASALMAQPRIQQALAETLAAMAPNLTEEVGAALIRGLLAPIEGEETTSDIPPQTWTEKARYVDLYAKLTGQKAQPPAGKPTKLVVTLPGSGE